jgi:hypothetical protein
VRESILWHHGSVSRELGDEGAQSLTEAQRQWLRHATELRRRAVEIATANPDLDSGDLYHALRCLELSPTERLRRGLTRVRIRSDRR